ncbi:hypothetical protein BDZ89DRAFT_1085403, partial [Hymenopellis radicata]
MRATLGTGSDDVHVCFDGDGRRCEAVVKELERRKKAKTQAAVSAAPKAATPKVNGVTPVHPKVNGGAGTPHGGTPRTLHPSLPSLPKPAHSLPKPPFPLPPKPGPVASTRDPSLAATPMRPVDEREADKEREREKMEILKRARQAVGGVVDDKEKEKEVEEGRRRGRLEGFKVRQTRVYDRRERERSRSRSRSRSRERRWDTYRGRGYRSRSRDRRYGRHEGRGRYTPPPPQRLVSEDDVEERLKANGRDHVLVTFVDGRSLGPNTDDEVRSFFERAGFGSDVESVLCWSVAGAQSGAYVTFGKGECCKAGVRVLDSEARRMVGYREVRVRVGEAVTCHGVWTGFDGKRNKKWDDLELLEAAARDDRGGEGVVVGEVRHVVRMGPQIEERVEETKQQKSGLKGLRFRKADQPEKEKAQAGGGGNQPTPKRPHHEIDEEGESEVDKLKVEKKVKKPKKVKTTKKRMVVVEEPESEDEEEVPLPPSRSPTPTPEPEPEPEEEDLGVWADDEDRWFTRLALDASSSPPQPPVPEESDADNAPHKSGAARTEGYYEIRIEDKLRYVTQYAERQRVAEDLKDAGNVNANNIPTGGVWSSRSNRASNRVKNKALEDIHNLNKAISASRAQTLQASSDLTFKFNQLQTRKKHLRFARSPIHSWGYALERISKGEMVIEYVGQVVRAQGIGSSYLFRIDEEEV